MKLSVIIPVYNEQSTLQEILRRVREADLDLDVEIIVVDDGSGDGSREILREEEKAGDLRIFYHERNQGKGAAVRTGIEQATGDLILIQDADLEYDPVDYPKLVWPFRRSGAKVVYGSRFRGGPHKAMLFTHMLANKLLTLMTNILYDSILSDMETGYKVFRTEVVKDIPLKSRGFEFEPEVTAKLLKRGYRIFEVPISYSGREYDEGKKIGLKDAFIALWVLLKYRFMD